MFKQYNIPNLGVAKKKTTPKNGKTPDIPKKYNLPIDKDSDDYKRLKHRAIAINNEKLHHRPADYHAWSKQKLTNEEKYYLWNSQGGKCARTECRAPLNESSMTIEHIVPKSCAPELTWDIRNMTILCIDCNRKKGAKKAINAATMRPFHYEKMSAVPANILKWNT
jgi:CRISPR/Cas system Type II protein with McrA/HNH and RuvC-like nuclease domain